MGNGVGCGTKHMDKMAFWKHVTSKQPGRSQGSRTFVFPQLLSLSPLLRLPVSLAMINPRRHGARHPPPGPSFVLHNEGHRGRKQEHLHKLRVYHFSDY